MNYVYIVQAFQYLKIRLAEWPTPEPNLVLTSDVNVKDWRWTSNQRLETQQFNFNYRLNDHNSQLDMVKS